jgi:arylformamidase
MLEDGENANLFFAENPFYKSKLLDLTEIEEKITAADLKEYNIEKNSFIILKTKNSQPGFLEKTPEKFIYLAESGAEYLIDKNIKGVGIDTNGIERSQSEHPTHKKLLAEKIIILEGLRLNQVPAGSYIMLLSLLKIADSDGLPGRAYLFENGEIETMLKLFK